jgi:hypothetical protein
LRAREPFPRRLPRHAQRCADARPRHPAVAQLVHAIAKSRFDIRRRRRDQRDRHPWLEAPMDQLMIAIASTI